MKPLLAAIRIKRVTAEVTDAAIVNQKVSGSASQKGEVKFGVGPDGKSLVQATMAMDATVFVDSTKEVLLSVHGEFEGVFVELEPAIDDASTATDAKKAADFYSAQLYPHAILHINRIFYEMGFGLIRLDVKYPLAL